MRALNPFLGKRAGAAVLISLLSLLLDGLPAPAQTSPPDLLAPGGWQLSAPHPGDAKLETLPLDGLPGRGEGLRFTVTRPTEPVWLVQISCGVPEAVPDGHVVQLRFRARSASHNPVRVTLEQPAAPYQGVVGRTIALTPTWQEYTIEGATPGFGPNGLSAHFQAGQQAGVVEIADATVTDLGPDPAVATAQEYLGAEQVRARIEKFRQGMLTIRVEDAAGRPVPSASVVVEQTRHAFLFGCNFFLLNPADTSPGQQTYQREFTALFNYATLPFYWGAFEAREGQPEYPRLDTMARWCAAHGMIAKGHPLIYHQVWPAWAPADPDAAIPLIKARVLDLVGHYKDTIHYWDVLNEATSAGDFAPPNGESRWIKRDGDAAAVGTALGWARTGQQMAGAPAETFLYNDYDTTQANVDLLTKLQAAGTLPDAVGIQSHMHSGNWPLGKAWQVCETFAKFGRPIHFTECTVLSGPRRPDQAATSEATDWNTTPEDEAKQADYVAQFYTLLFSHPAVRAITWWDFTDSHAWKGAPGGLVRKDMSPKPAYTRLMDLIHRQWWTHASGTTDRTGMFAQRVFYGEYRITVTGPGGRTQTRTIDFPASSAPLTTTIPLP